MGRKDRNQDMAKRIAIGSTLAAAAGFIAGVLTAPKSGKQTRSDIKNVADKSMSEAEKDLKRLHTDLNKIINDAKTNGDALSDKARNELEDLLERAKDTKEKAREMLSALHEGGTNDRDLKKAIKDANAAIDHLRDFIKK